MKLEDRKSFCLIKIILIYQFDGNVQKSRNFSTTPSLVSCEKVCDFLNVELRLLDLLYEIGIDYVYFFFYCYGCLNFIYFFGLVGYSVRHCPEDLGSIPGHVIPKT